MHVPTNTYTVHSRTFALHHAPDHTKFRPFVELKCEKGLLGGPYRKLRLQWKVTFSEEMPPRVSVLLQEAMRTIVYYLGWGLWTP